MRAAVTSWRMCEVGQTKDGGDTGERWVERATAQANLGQTDANAQSTVRSLAALVSRQQGRVSRF